MLEHKTVLSFQVTHNGNQTGNRLCFLSLLPIIIYALTHPHEGTCLTISVHIYMDYHGTYIQSSVGIPQLQQLCHGATLGEVQPS